MMLYEIYQQYPIITTDSRDCPKNSIFFALKGESFDGNRYALSAIKKGCSFAVVDDTSLINTIDETTKERLIFVPNVLNALQDLARKHRQTLGTTIIGVTGTNGKTTTKELIAAVLQERYNILYTQGNVNNHIGVPKTLLGLRQEHELAVVEMGANHPGEIRTLVNIAEPNYGIITNVGKAHLEGFGSLEGVIRTKGELYDYLRDHRGKAFINEKNPYLMGISEGLTLIKYGNAGRIISCDPFLCYEWNGITIQTQLIGAYNLDNCLVATAVGQQFGITDEQICHAITHYTPTNNRSQFKKTQHNALIIDAYNANPTSMMAALENFSAMNAANKMLILGDMKELGSSSEEEHAKIVKYIITCGVKNVWLVGNEFCKTATDDMRTFQDVDEVITELKNTPLYGHTILIKGSNSTHLMNVVPLID